MGKQLSILLDPGHGGDDPGAVYGSVREADINLRVATRLWQMLEDAGHQVAMTRTTDATLHLFERAAAEREHGCDLFVSIHVNAAQNRDARGMEIWTSPGRTAADAVATAVFRALEKAFGLATPMRQDLSDGDPDREARFYVLAKTRCPAVLIELGFLSNDHDRAFLTDPENQTDLAAVIASGIEAWNKG